LLSKVGHTLAWFERYRTGQLAKTAAPDSKADQD